MRRDVNSNLCQTDVFRLFVFLSETFRFARKDEFCSFMSYSKSFAVALCGRRCQSNQSPGKLLCVERAQIGGLFAGADGVDGEFEGVGQRHDDAGAGAAVELCHDQAGEVDHFFKGFDLADRVLADGGVQREQDRVRRAGVDFADDADDFA